MIIRAAVVDEHNALVKIARTSTYTKDFSNRVMFSSDAAYEKGWIRVAIIGRDQIIGFTCVRQKRRPPETMLYFVTVMPEWRSQGAGRLLVEDLLTNSESGKVVLNVAKDNERAIQFYIQEGFRFNRDIEPMQGTAHRMEKTR